VVKRVLMVAYHYPPASVSSGIQRTLRFSTYLPEWGWQPLVLTAHPRAYEHTSKEQLADIPHGLSVRRAFALDTARHLSLRGRYASFMALPDRWATWWIGGVAAGLAMIRREKPAALWSTYPIATAHLIGLTLHRLTGLPWVADFRDSMTEEHYPPHPTVRAVYRWIERRAVAAAATSVFTTPGTLALYQARYAHVPRERFSVIENGYDESNFSSAESAVGVPASRMPITLLHSGVLYPSERDPTQFFDAIAELKQAGAISAATLRVCLRATRHDSLFKPELERRAIDDIVKLEPAIGYEDALCEMLTATALLIFQASNCNHQIPAKLYEYFRARRPVLGLTDPRGDTAHTMRDAGLNAIAPLDDKEAIKSTLVSFVANLENGRAEVASESAVQRASRRGRTAQLAAVLDSVAR
jgi:hypothetical protein